MAYYSKKQFTPKKTVYSFRDLEVYQKTLECSVLISKDIRPALVRARYGLLENLVNASMSIPLYIVESHSLRFADFDGAIALLEKAMSTSNKMVVYLEQIKGLYGSKVNVSLIDDIINRYMETRGKMFRLEKSWKRFKDTNPENQKPRFNY
jgi:hypothetical protein